MIFERIYIDCECSDPDHTLAITRYPKTEGDEAELYLHIRLADRETVWGRIKTGIRYILKLNNEYNYTETLISKDEAKKLRTILTKYIND